MQPTEPPCSRAKNHEASSSRPKRRILRIELCLYYDGAQLSSERPNFCTLQAALAAMVFLIGVRLVDVHSLGDIYQFRTTTFAVAVATLGAVVWFGVERGIFIAIGLSVLDHMRQEYHPKDVVMTAVGSTWRLERADPGIESEPGIVVYRFEAPLFFANADYFGARIRDIVERAPHPVIWFVLDLVGMNEIDCTGALTLTATITHLRERGVTVALAGAQDVSSNLDRLGIFGRVSREHIFDTAHEAVEAYRKGGTPVNQHRAT